MAELAPEDTASTGTGPRGEAPRPGVDYRQLQNPVMPLSPDQLPSTGRVQEAEQLAATLKNFSGKVQDFAVQRATQAGAIAGAAAGQTGTPALKDGLTRFSAYNQAYNNAALRSYLIETSIATDAQAATLQIQANKNPGTYLATATAARDAAIKAAPVQAQGEIAEMWNKHIAQGNANVSAANANDIVDRQRTLVDVDIGVSTNKIAKMQADAMITGNPTSMAEAADENTKLFARIQAAANTGTISQVEAAGRIAAAHRSIFEQTWVSQFEHELNTSPDPQAALKIIDKFHVANAANTVLSEDEEHKLSIRMFSDLKEQNLVVAKLKSLSKSDEQLKYEVGDKVYTGLYLTGQLTEAKLAQGVANSDIRPERATGLVQLMKNANTEAKSDQRVINKTKLDPQFLDKTDDEIIRTPGINAKDAGTLIAERDKRNTTYEGTQEYKDGVQAINRALKILPGPTGMLSDADRKRQTDAIGDYHDAVKNTDPAKRSVNMAALAQQAITNANARAAAADLTNFVNGRAAYQKRMTPDNPDYPGEKGVADRLKHYDDQISQARALAFPGSK